MALHAQGVIDPLNGDSLSQYTDTATLDNSDGAGEGVTFSDSSGALTASYAGTGTSAEQALFLASASDFSTLFAPGQTLFVDTSVPASSTQMDFGLAIAATATPTGAGSGNGYNSRASFDWASISLRPSQTAIRVNTSISGTLNTGSGVVGLPSGGTADVSQLFITWDSTTVSGEEFTLGYVLNGTSYDDESVTFAPGSAIGSAIGFYGDLRATGTSLGGFSDLSIEPVPEPATLALFALGGLSSLLFARRRD